jgi:hypothetical protein
MSDETVYEGAETRSRRGLGTFFRRIARALGGGEPVPADEEQSVTVEPAAEADLEVEVEREDGEVSMEIDVSWDEDAGGAVETEAVASKATFETYEDESGEHRWRLRHRNGNNIANGSQGYASRQKCKQGLESVRENAPGAATDDLSREDDPVEEGTSGGTFELYEDDGGKFRWRLRHRNGNVIADSGQGYASKQKCKQGMRSVRENCRGAPVEAVE